MELGEFDSTYKIRTSIKSQALADFIIGIVPEEPFELHNDVLQTIGEWTLRMDGSSNIYGCRIGIFFELPTKEVIE